MSTAFRWGWRVLFGAVLLYFAEIVWWSSDPRTHSAGDWLLLVALYVAVAALLLDLMSRFGVIELISFLTVAGLYGLVNGALITRTAFESLPISLVSRPLGLHTLGGGVLAMLFLSWLLDGRDYRPGRAVTLGLVGLVSGLWVRWYPALPNNDFPVPGVLTVLLLSVGGLAVIGLLLYAMSRGKQLADPASFRLRVWEWLAVGLVFAVAFWQTAAEGRLSATDGAILLALVGYMLMLLRFLRRDHPSYLVSFLAAPQPVQLKTFLFYAGLLVLPVMLGYAIPGEGPEGMPFRVLTTAIAGFGIGWLPGASLAVGFRAYITMFRKAG